MSINAEALTVDQREIISKLSTQLQRIVNRRLCPNTVADANAALQAIHCKNWRLADLYISYASMTMPEWEFGTPGDQQRFKDGTTLCELYEKFKTVFDFD